MEYTEMSNDELLNAYKEKYHEANAMAGKLAKLRNEAKILHHQWMMRQAD